MKNRAFAQPLYKQSVSQMEALDTIRVEPDGRTYAYALAGAANLAVGKMTEQAPPVATASDEVVAASGVAGDMSVSITFGGAVTADFYKDGYLWFNDDTGEGYFYRVAGHPAGTTAVSVALKDPIRLAFTAGATTVSLKQNRQALVVIAATTLAAAPAGVPGIPVTAGYYFWNQVKGPAVVLTAGTLVIGNVASVMTTAGAVGPRAETDILTSVGTVMAVNATTEYSLINLAIPGY